MNLMQIVFLVGLVIAEIIVILAQDYKYQKLKKSIETCEP